jgi:quercetin dioxygenase-like cupin family protein
MRKSSGGHVQITVSSAMHLLSFGPKHGTPITGYHSHGASAVPLGSGRGESHVYCIYLGPGGEIGPHEAGFDQLFLILAGSGWVSGADGVRKELRDGEGALIARGEIHAKGSTSGLTAIMVQLTELTAASAPGVA